MSGVYVIRVDFADGTSLYPARITREGPNWSSDLDEATAHYERLYRGRGILSFEYASKLAHLPLPNAATLPEWRDIRESGP